MSMTLEDALTQLRERLSDTAQRTWSDPQLMRWLNEGQRDLVNRTECLPTTADVEVLTGMYQLPAPTNCIKLHKVEWATTFPVSSADMIYPLEYQSIRNLDGVRGAGQQTATGIPAIYSTWGAPGASFRVVIYPKPQSGGTLRLWYYRQPVAMATGADAIDVPEGWEHMVLDYAEFRAKVSDGDQTWQVAKADYEAHIETVMTQFARLSDANDNIGVDPFYSPNYDYGGW